MADDAIAGIERYRRILTECIPALTIRSCERSGEGWDNVALLVNEKLIVRIAKRPDVALRLRNEARLLPELSATLPAAVPNFEHVCGDTLSGGMRLIAYPILPGTFLTPERLAALAAAQQERLARQIGEFLTALHAFPAERAAALLVPVGRSGVKWRSEYVTFYAEVRECVLPLLGAAERARVVSTWEDYLDHAANFQFPPTLLHRDLSPVDHILIEPETGSLVGVIDWGDASIGDPALDFTGLLSELGRYFAERVAAHYAHPLDATFWQRVEFFGWLAPFHEIRFGQIGGDETHVQRGLAALRAALVSD